MPSEPQTTARWARPVTVFVAGYAAVGLLEALSGKTVAVSTSALVFLFCVIVLAPEKKAHRG